jgi:molybdate transport system substrate-binding protein
MRLMLSAALLVALQIFPAAAVELRIISPGIVYNAALGELVADYNKKSGNTVIIVHGTMDKIIGQAKSDTPPADVVGLPPDLMNTLYLDGGIVGATYTPLGRGELGLAVKKGAPKPDISTVAKLAQAMNGRTVMVNDPKGGTMQGVMIEGILKRPEFAGAHVTPSSRGEGAAALARGEGDMAVQLVQEILNKPEIEVVAPLPVELGGHIDAVLAVSSRSTHPREATDFIKFLTRPEAKAAWAAKGFKPF